MLEILLVVVALGGVAALAREFLLLLAARQTYSRTQDAAQKEAHEEWKRRQAERNRKRVDRQAELNDWTRKFMALLPPPPPRPEPEGEPLAVIRAWDGTIVGKIWDEPPDYRASNAAAIEHEIALAEDLQRQRNWKP